jgi:hypothetical protein
MLAALLLVAADAPSFPERVPGLMEACLKAAVAAGDVSETDDSHKYICAGPPAAELWALLESAKVEAWEQDAGPDGRWLSRSFPLGGCFKRVRHADGSPATDGLSCSIWIPKPPAPAPATKG